MHTNGFKKKENTNASQQLEIDIYYSINKQCVEGVKKEKKLCGFTILRREA